MLVVETVAKIRREHFGRGKGVKTIARELGLSRNTVRNWLRTPEEVRKPTYSRKAVFGKLSGHVAELEHALKATPFKVFGKKPS